LVGIGMTLLAACNGDSNQPVAAGHNGAPRAIAAAKRGPTPAELTKGMVEAVTQENSAVPVIVKFEVQQRPVVGREVDVTIAVMPQAAAESAAVRARSSDGLHVGAAVGPIDIVGLDPDSVYRFTIPVTASAEGVQVLELDVALKHDDVTETRVFSVPLIVAAAGAAGAAAGRPAAAGGAVVGAASR
jgi:hypothetical protein